MKRTITNFVCQECGYDSPQWLGKCPECGGWNTFKEFVVAKEKAPISGTSFSNNIVLTPKTIAEITYKKQHRLTTSFSEMNTVLGGGIVSGSVILLAGDPGVGKSTLLLQIGLSLALEQKNTSEEKQKVLYISGEESEEQVKLRAERIAGGKKTDNFLLLSLSNPDAIVGIIERVKPSVVMIDSIQAMESEQVGGLSGSIGQIRYATAIFIKTAKSLGIPTFLVGHVTKEGMVAGPMVLSHMVDTVLFLEGEKATKIRILRSLKNRFGPVDEVGIFTMDGEGLVETKDIDRLFLSNAKEKIPGSVLVSTLEGTRAFLVEVQGLVVSSKLPIPRRVASGIDTKRLELLLAVLQKHCRLPLGGMDIFVNVAGDLKLSDRACDLGICLSIVSSFQNKSLNDTVAIAEVGLLGELRTAPMLEKRVKEAKKLGFTKVITAQTQKTLDAVLRSLKS